MASDCKFCEKLELYKDLRKETSDEFGEDYAVALVVRTWHKPQGKRAAGRTMSFRYRGLGWKLNYCPECGKKLGGKS